MYAHTLCISPYGSSGEQPGPGCGHPLWRLMGGHGHGRARHGGWGPRGAFGADFPFGRGPGGGSQWRGRKARRGDIRMAALLLLSEEPRNGYQIMQEVEERSGGAWRPSPGSVYPALQQLEDEGLIRSEEVEGRKLFDLTDAGRAYVEERGAQPPPWEAFGAGAGGRAELGAIVRELAFAFAQVMRHGSDEQVAQAREVLMHARRALYGILADGEPGGAPPGGGE